MHSHLGIKDFKVSGKIDDYVQKKGKGKIGKEENPWVRKEEPHLFTWEVATENMQLTSNKQAIKQLPSVFPLLHFANTVILKISTRSGTINSKMMCKKVL